MFIYHFVHGVPAHSSLHKKTGLQWKEVSRWFVYVVFLWHKLLYMISFLCSSIKSNVYVYICYSTQINFAVLDKRREKY